MHWTIWRLCNQILSNWHKLLLKIRLSQRKSPMGIKLYRLLSSQLQKTSLGNSKSKLFWFRCWSWFLNFQESLFISILTRFICPLISAMLRWSVVTLKFSRMLLWKTRHTDSFHQRSQRAMTLMPRYGGTWALFSTNYPLVTFAPFITQTSK